MSRGNYGIRRAFVERLRLALPGLLGLVVMAGLLPLRGNWAVAIVLTGLAFSVLGVLALRAVRVSSEAVVAYPLYVPAASLFVITVGGLLADLLGPPLGVALPLRGVTAGDVTLGFGFVLWVAGLSAPAAARLPWRTTLQRPSLLLPLALPAAAAVGALLLSNGHGPVVARIVAVLTVLVLMTTLLLARRLSRAHVGMLLFACALAMEWAFSIRSREVIGFDITTEIQIAQHIHTVGLWRTVHPNDAYGAMLSLTVLPSTIAALTGITPLLAFKVLYPILSALLPVSIFFVAEKLMRRSFAAGAGALLAIQYYFFQLMPELARQEIGLVFFAALVAALLDQRLRGGARARLVAGFGIGLVVSHYSSTYVAISVVVIALILQALVGRWRQLPIVSRPLLVAVIATVGGAALWYGPVTHSSSNLSDFTAGLQRNGLNLLPFSNGSFLTSYLKGNTAAYVTGSRFEQLAVRNYRPRRAYIHPLHAAGLPQYTLQTATVPGPKVRAPGVATGISDFSIIFGQLMIAFAVVGALMMVLSRRTARGARLTGILALATLGILALERFSGTAAGSYNQSRALLQCLILLAIPAAWMAQWIAGRFRRLRTAVSALLVLSFGLMFAQQNGVSALAIGGGTSLNLSQRGEDFERQYMTPAEFAGAIWVSRASGGQLLYADPYAQFRLNATTGVVALQNVTPRTLDRDAWIYGTNTNVNLGRGRGSADGYYAIYQWPAKFLNTYWNTVYDNGQSRVYHR